MDEHRRNMMGWLENLERDLMGGAGPGLVSNDRLMRDDARLAGMQKPGAGSAGGGLSLRRAMSHMLTLDLQESEDEYSIRADLPGVAREDISVEISDGRYLTITAERKHLEEAGEDNFHVQERFFGRVTRKVELPSDADFSKSSAEYKDGVLHLTMPKKDKRAAGITTIPIS